MPVNVSFGASTQALEAGVDRGGSALRSLMGPVGDLKDAFGELTDGVGAAVKVIGSGAVSAFSALAGEVGHLATSGKDFAAGSFFKLLLGGGVIAAGIGGAIDLVGKMNSQMLDLATNAREVGLSLADFQKYQYIASAGGVGGSTFAEQMRSAFDKYKGLLDGSNDDLKKFLDANHVAWKDAAGDVFSFNDYLLTSNRLIANAGEGANRFAAETKAGDILGFGRQMTEVWGQLPATFQALGDEAVKVGAVLDENVVNKGAQAEKEWQHTVAQWQSWWQSAIGTVTAGIDALIKRASEIPTPGGQGAGQTGLFGNFATQPLTAPIAKAAAAIAEFTQQSEDFGVHVGGYIGDAAYAADRVAQAFTSVGAEAAAAAPQVRAALVAAANVAPGAESAMGAVLAQLKAWGVAGYNDAQAFVALAHAKTEATSQPAPSGPKTVFPGDDGDDDSKLNEVKSHYRMMVESVDEFYASQKQHLSSDLALHRITYDQEAAELLQSLDARKVAEDGFFDAEIAAVKAAGANYEAIVRLKSKADEKWQLEHDKIVSAALQKDAAEWQSALSPVLSAWNSQLRGLLAGTESWSTAMRKIFGDLVIQVIEGFEKMALAKAASGLADMFKGTALGGGPQSFMQNLLGGGGQSAAQGANTSALGLLTQQIITLNATLGGHAVATGANTAATTTDTAATTTGATATTANTGGLLSTAATWIGNTAATIANTVATNAQAIASGVKSLIPFAQGSWEVPATMPALIHKGEMIVPAEGGHADAMRTLLGGFSFPKFAVGTDYIMRGGLGFLHPGETVIPAARGSGPFTGTGMGGGGITRGDFHGMLSEHREQMGQMMAMNSRAVSGLQDSVDALRRRLR